MARASSGVTAGTATSAWGQGPGRSPALRGATPATKATAASGRVTVREGRAGKRARG
jgi:hypothetical protein